MRTTMRFSGITFDPDLDGERLETQFNRVKRVMSSGAWYSLRELSALCGGTEPAVSARVRDLRKAAFGGHTITRRRVGAGVFLYQMEARA